MRWLVLALLLATPVGAQELIELGHQNRLLDATDPLNTHPFDCHETLNGQGAGVATITYKMPQDLRLMGVDIFVGAWNDLVADIGYSLADGAKVVLPQQNWDHYSNVTDSNTIQWRAPVGTYITLHSGDVLTLAAYCDEYVHDYYPPNVPQAHVAVTLLGY